MKSSIVDVSSNDESSLLADGANIFLLYLVFVKLPSKHYYNTHPQRDDDAQAHLLKEISSLKQIVANQQFNRII